MTMIILPTDIMVNFAYMLLFISCLAVVFCCRVTRVCYKATLIIMRKNTDLLCSADLIQTTQELPDLPIRRGYTPGYETSDSTEDMSDPK